MAEIRTTHGRKLKVDSGHGARSSLPPPTRPPPKPADAARSARPTTAKGSCIHTWHHLMLGTVNMWVEGGGQTDIRRGLLEGCEHCGVVRWRADDG